jgi:transketolase
MGSLMKQQVINVYTHDSIGQGEDGPTHQPIEQLSNLRTTPNMAVWRPSDAVETAVAWKQALQRSTGPSSLIFSRQGLPHQARSAEQLADIERGGYVLEDCDGTPDVIVIATGSEVSIARDAVKTLQQDGIAARLVAMPSVEYFLAQDADYREQVLPAQVRRRLAVEAGAADYWYKFVGLDGDVIGMTSFGESAPGGVMMKEFGFTPENIVNRAKALVSNG